MTVSVWTLVAAVWLAVFAGCVFGWMLRGSRSASGRGGMLDLTPAPRGELDLDWQFPVFRRRHYDQDEVRAIHAASLSADIVAARVMTIEQAKAAYAAASLA